ncbi:MAG: hypothetical protein ACTSR8_22120 [Promethearchaeota archaeon]
MKNVRYTERRNSLSYPSRALKHKINSNPKIQEIRKKLIQDKYKKKKEV